MKKVIDLLKKYLVIGIVVSIIMFIWVIFSDTLPTVDLLYILKSILLILSITVIVLPVIAMVDWLIVESAKALFDDFKYADKSGRITIIIVSIGLFIKMISEWNR